MKTLFLALLICSSLHSFSQDISGIYSGTIKNDSLKMTQNYELALSEYKGKITGYSYITFVKNDTFYYGIKRVKATRENGQLVVVDDEMLMNNYPQRPDKGVHLINTFPLVQGDSVIDLNGTWKTTASKKHGFYSIGGNMSLRKDSDSSHSPLISHLKELNVIKYQDDKRMIVKKEEKPKQNKASDVAQTKSKDLATEKTTTTNQPSRQETQVITQTKTNNEIVKQSSSIAKTKEDKNGDVLKQTTPQIGAPSSEASNAVAKTSADKIIDSKSSNTSISNNETTASLAVTADAKTETAPSRTGDRNQTAVATTSAKISINNNLIPAALETRTTNTIQTVMVTSDSITLAFYDNGIVDGDSISVYVDNENIISKTKLTEVAAKRTVYTTGRGDEIKITLVAESLGSLPPNTGLLIIQDGTERYNVRFSADMETNASIILKKKR